MSLATADDQARVEHGEVLPAPVKSVQTREEKLMVRATALHAAIIKYTAEYNEIISALQAIKAIKNVKVGDRAAGNFRRANTARVVEGVVQGVQQTANGVQIKIIIGTGFDTDVVVLNESNIISIAPSYDPNVPEAV